MDKNAPEQLWLQQPAPRNSWRRCSSPPAMQISYRTPTAKPNLIWILWWQNLQAICINNSFSLHFYLIFADSCLLSGQGAGTRDWSSTRTGAGPCLSTITAACPGTVCPCRRCPRWSSPTWTQTPKTSPPCLVASLSRSWQARWGAAASTPASQPTFPWLTMSSARK